MPYPISKLAYGLRSRLHDLATPAERVELQVAAGTPSICPPLQKGVYFFKKVTLHCNNGTTTFSSPSNSNLSVAPSEKALVFSEQLSFFGADVQSLTYEELHYFIMPKRINLSCCDFSNDFFKALRPFVSKCTRLGLDLKNTVNPVEMVATFPKLEELAIRNSRNLPKTWLNELLQCSGQLSFLEFRMCDGVFNDVTCDELVAFLKAQKRGFRLSLDYYSITQEDKFFAFVSELKAKLPYGKGRHRRVTRHIYIAHHNSSEDVVFFLPKNPDNKMFYVKKQRPKR